MMALRLNELVRGKLSDTYRLQRRCVAAKAQKHTLNSAGTDIEP
jgi:hypothetical protein